MKRDQMLFIVIVALAVSLFFCGNSLLEAKKATVAGNQQDLDLQRALAYQEVQNLISAHTYCYEAQQQYFEIENFWSARDDISYNENVTREETVNYYCKTNERARRAKLEKMSELFSGQVKNTKENEGIGDMVIHLVTTPYIVVAGDCNTARGLWYVPSVNVEIDENGEPVPVTIWEKCDVDFIRENGRWKIWHFRQWVQFAGALDKGLFDGSFRLQRPFFTPQPMQQQESRKALPKVLQEKSKQDQAYSTLRVAGWRPELPMPYDTWED